MILHNILFIIFILLLCGCTDSICGELHSIKVELMHFNSFFEEYARKDYDIWGKRKDWRMDISNNIPVPKITYIT